MAFFYEVNKEVLPLKVSYGGAKGDIRSFIVVMQTIFNAFINDPRQWNGTGTTVIPRKRSSEDEWLIIPTKLYEKRRRKEPQEERGAA